MSLSTRYVKGRHLKSVLRPVALAGFALALLPALASAATTENTTQFEVKAGSLTFSAAPAMPSLPSVTLNGQAQTTNTTMTNYTVQDATGSGSGWNTTVEGQVGSSKSAVFKQYCPEAGCGTIGYTAGGAEIPADSLTLNSTGASFIAQNESTGTAPTLVCNSGCTVDHGSAQKVASAATSAGMGTWATTGFSATSLALKTASTLKVLPAKMIYRVNLLWTLSTGP